MMTGGRPETDTIMLEFVRNYLDLNGFSPVDQEFSELGISPKVSLENFLVSLEEEDYRDGTYS